MQAKATCKNHNEQLVVRYIQCSVSFCGKNLPFFLGGGIMRLIFDFETFKG
jgi:hypothetical protein